MLMCSRCYSLILLLFFSYLLFTYPHSLKIMQNSQNSDLFHVGKQKSSPKATNSNFCMSVSEWVLSVLNRWLAGSRKVFRAFCWLDVFVESVWTRILAFSELKIILSTFWRHRFVDVGLNLIRSDFPFDSRNFRSFFQFFLYIFFPRR